MSKLAWLCYMAAITVFPVQANDRYTSIITVNVTIVAEPCVINNNQNIDVDFGSEVSVADVAAGLVEKNINYELDCEGMDNSKFLTMTITGPNAEFNAGVLKTSIADLGVKFNANGNDFPLHSSFYFANPATKPVLTALLVKKTGASLETGAFNSGATMTVTYQ